MLYIIFVTLFLMISNNPVCAEDTLPTETYQGVISSTEGMPGYLIINESKVLLGENTEVKDSKERIKSLSDLKNGKWVYIVAERRPSGITAQRIYLLPNKIKNRDKHEYHFMQMEEESENTR